MWSKWSDIDRMFNAMNLLQNRMNWLFSDFDRFKTFPTSWDVNANGPRTNLYDTGEHMEMSIEVPGLSKEDLNIKLQGNYLEVSGTRKSDAPEGYTAHRMERGTTSFTRSFTLPADVEADKVEANLENGVLTSFRPVGLDGQ